MNDNYDNASLEKAVDTSPVKDMPVAVLGFGSQGRAQALNLRDSGCDVTIGLRPGGNSAKQAEADGFQVKSFAEAAKTGQLIVILTPDMTHGEIFDRDILPNLNEGDTVLFAHGFSVLYDQVKPPENVDVIMVAPKGPGNLVRREYQKNQGVPCLFAVHQDATGQAKAKALAYASLIGGTATGAIETTFKEETETDLFGEQAILCGGATELVKAGYDTLVEAGYQPEVAYFECLHELKLIVDLLYEGGLAKMYEFISDTASYGALKSGPRVVNNETRARMKEVLLDIQSGAFAKLWTDENANGNSLYHKLRDDEIHHAIEATGTNLRNRMAWLQKG